MSRNLGTPQNYNGLEIQNAVIQNLGAAPSNPTPGRFYFSTSLSSTLVWNGTAWIPTDPAQVPAGYIPFSKVAGIQTAINATPINTLAGPTANIAMGGYTLTGLATPTAAGQAAEYSWVVSQIQTAAAGISSKAAVNVVATSSITLSGLGAVVDGITLSAGMRVLAVAQSTTSQNGPYIVGSGAWTQPTDDGSNFELTPGALWLVEQGTVNAATQWSLANTGTITPGTTAITINKFNAAPVYTAFNGVALASGVFSAQVVAGGGILAGASGLQVDTTVVSRFLKFTIGDGSSTSFTVTHNLNNGYPIVQVQSLTAAGGGKIDVDVACPTVNTTTIGFATAPAANSYVVSIAG